MSFFFYTQIKATGTLLVVLRSLGQSSYLLSLPYFFAQTPVLSAVKKI